MKERHGQPPKEAKSLWSEMNNTLQCCVLVGQPCLFATLWTVAPRILCPWDFLCPLSTAIVQARKLEWVAMPSSRGSFQSRDQTQVSCTAGRFFTIWVTREAKEYWSGQPIPSPGDLLDPGIESGSPALKADSLPAKLPGKPTYNSKWG